MPKPDSATAKTLANAIRHLVASRGAGAVGLATVPGEDGPTTFLVNGAGKVVCTDSVGRSQGADGIEIPFTLVTDLDSMVFEDLAAVLCNVTMKSTDLDGLHTLSALPPMPLWLKDVVERELA